MTADLAHALLGMVLDGSYRANPASSSDCQAGKDAEKMQWVFYSVGAGALATGAALYLLGYSQATSAQVGLAPILGPRSAGLSVRGGF